VSKREDIFVELPEAEKIFNDDDLGINGQILKFADDTKLLNYG